MPTTRTPQRLDRVLHISLDLDRATRSAQRRGSHYGSAVDVRRAAELYAQGRSLRQIGGELGVPWTAVGHQLRQAGVTMRRGVGEPLLWTIDLRQSSMAQGAVKAASVLVVSRSKQIENCSIFSVRQAAAACNVSPPVVRRWLSLGLLSAPPWPVEQLWSVRNLTDAQRRRRGSSAAHGTMARWNSGCSCARWVPPNAKRCGQSTRSA
jgi:hypothetical protein